jgi:hypothetical protein
MKELSLKFLTFITLCAIVPLAVSSAGLKTDGYISNSGIKAFETPIVNDENDCRIVINELMVDPTPLVGLPDFEWIELMNISNCRINLAGWRIVVGTTSRTLPEAWIEPGEYIIVCTSAGSSELQKWGKTAVISLPALRNSGNRITLYDPGSQTIDIVNYSDTWYRDNKKKDGGWTLERIDPFRSCGEAANWIASMDPRGGTPGEVNSVFADNTDRTQPDILWAGAISINSVEIIFSEPMDTVGLKTLQNYSLTGGRGEPAGAILKNENTVVLNWSQSFQLNTTYSLSFINISDACGNLLSESMRQIQWIELEPDDVVVNEVLFNPFSGSVDFVELYNRSAKRIDAGKLVLAGRDRNLTLRQQVSLKTVNKVIEPGEYIAVTINRLSVLSFYISNCPECIYNLPSMPAYNNDEGWVVLLDDSQTIIDEFHYTEKMHHRLLHNVKGVSLERINPDLPAPHPGNWLSASSDVGFATPGYQNSQYQTGPSFKADVIVEPQAFSPNGDGYNDELLIHYKTPGPGWVANAWVFDTAGRTIMQLLKNQLLATDGTITWNGEDQTGSRIPLGPYILFFEMYDLNGNLERFKKAIYITDRWE